MASQPSASSADAPSSDDAERAYRHRALHDDSLKVGFNVVGYVSSNMGMSVAARHYIRLLLDRGHAVSILDLDPGPDQDRRDRTYAELTVAHARDLPHSINLIMVNISRLPDFFLRPPEGLFREDRVNAGLIWWELTVLPDRWVEALRLFDVVLAGSDFVQHVVAFNVPGVRVVRAKHPVYLPAGGVARDRSRFGLPEDPVLFLSSFEPLSGVERKNPFAGVAAFQRAFPDRSDRRAGLIIKLNNTSNPTDVRVQRFVGALTERCKGDSRLVVIAESLSYAEVLQLYASCDVFVSLHRSEGLGLGPLEAMCLGRPAIATGWSGNLTYMNSCNACLVSHRFIPAGGDPHYAARFLGKAGFWADPDIDEAAQWMRALVDSPELLAGFARRAFESAEIYQKDAEAAGFVEEIRAIWQRRERASATFGASLSAADDVAQGCSGFSTFHDASP